MWTNYERFSYSYNVENYFMHMVNMNIGKTIFGFREMVAYTLIILMVFDLHFLTGKMSVYYKQVTNVNDEEKKYVNEYKLSQNYPNPFNPATTINYSLPYDSKVKIIIYDVAGQKIKELVNFVESYGTHKVEFNLDGLNLSSGIYFYSFEANAVDGSSSFRQTKKMILLK